MYAAVRFHRVTISHQHLDDDSTVMWEVRRLRGAETADK
jgi:hypothetical protein